MKCLTNCCTVIYDNLNFCCAQVKEKFNDDLLIGTEHSKKIIPTCVTPINTLEEMSQDDKVQIVLNDPKFGMHESIVVIFLNVCSLIINLIYISICKYISVGYKINDID